MIFGWIVSIFVSLVLTSVLNLVFYFFWLNYLISFFCTKSFSSVQNLFHLYQIFFHLYQIFFIYTKSFSSSSNLFICTKSSSSAPNPFHLYQIFFICTNSFSSAPNLLHLCQILFIFIKSLVSSSIIFGWIVSIFVSLVLTSVLSFAFCFFWLNYLISFFCTKSFSSVQNLFHLYQIFFHLYQIFFIYTKSFSSSSNLFICTKSSSSAPNPFHLYQIFFICTNSFSSAPNLLHLCQILFIFIKSLVSSSIIFGWIVSIFVSLVLTSVLSFAFCFFWLNYLISFFCTKSFSSVSNLHFY